MYVFANVFFLVINSRSVKEEVILGLKLKHPPLPQCLKITQNVAFETHLFAKTSWQSKQTLTKDGQSCFLLSCISYCTFEFSRLNPIRNEVLNATFSAIFKHRVASIELTNGSVRNFSCFTHIIVSSVVKDRKMINDFQKFFFAA